MRYPKHLMSCTIALAHTLTPSHTVRGRETVDFYDDDDDVERERWVLLVVDVDYYIRWRLKLEGC